MEKKFTVTSNDCGLRLDKFIMGKLKELSRQKCKEYIHAGGVLVNDSIKKTSYYVKTNDRIRVCFDGPKRMHLAPYPQEIAVIYEDQDIIVVNKPQDLMTHPAHEGGYVSLLNALIYMGKTLWGPHELRPGVVHRLDKETTGVMVLAKNELSYNSLVEQFKQRTIKKTYSAIVWGVIKQNELSIHLPLKRDPRNRLKMKVGFLSSKEALTKVEVVKRFKGATLVKVNLLTGRMHQIRVHFNFLGFPIVGDKKYGKKDTSKHLLLHSRSLALRHPRSDALLEFEAACPEWFNEFERAHTHAYN